MGNVMQNENKALNRRLRKVEAAKSQTRKVGYTLFAVAVTSFFMVVSGAGL
jgi:hypothetical protein